jgi:hypothetical protein
LKADKADKADTDESHEDSMLGEDTVGQLEEEHDLQTEEVVPYAKNQTKCCWNCMLMVDMEHPNH